MSDNVYVPPTYTVSRLEGTIQYWLDRKSRRPDIMTLNFMEYYLLATDIQQQQRTHWFFDDTPADMVQTPDIPVPLICSTKFGEITVYPVMSNVVLSAEEITATAVKELEYRRQWWEDDNRRRQEYLERMKAQEAKVLAAEAARKQAKYLRKQAKKALGGKQPVPQTPYKTNLKVGKKGRR